MSLILLHPGDLSGWDWVALLGMFLIFIVLPICLAGFAIYRIVAPHARDTEVGEAEHVTLGLNDSRQMK